MMSREMEIFVKYLNAKGLKATERRRAVFNAFQSFDGHVSAEELFEAVRDSGIKIGIASVWRTLRLIQKAGLAEEHYFGKSGIRYEKRKASDSHGHIVCNDCGRVEEFDLTRFLPLIDDITKSKGFNYDGFEISLTGTCRSCRHKKPVDSLIGIERAKNA
jgi:Fur family ferric uptake transcriptional regulator